MGVVLALCERTSRQVPPQEKKSFLREKMSAVFVRRSISLFCRLPGDRGDRQVTRNGLNIE
jgi:hypothetical protein